VKPIGKMSVGELAAFIATHLRTHNIDVVLTGGACVSIYSNGKYVSLDLDFIDNHFTRRAKIKEALSEIGFVERDRFFTHPETPLFVEFPAGPLAVGAEPVKETIVMEFETGILPLISPTDCLKDRLAAYYHWGDRQCLEQAVLVAVPSPRCRPDIHLQPVQGPLSRPIPPVVRTAFGRRSISPRRQPVSSACVPAVSVRRHRREER